MKVVLYSNYINHHQIPLAEAFNSIKGVEYIFVATTPFDSKRASMGYEDENTKHDFVLRTYDGADKERKALKLAKEADIVMVGSAPDMYMAERLGVGKVTFHVSERYYKKGLNPKTFLKYYASTMRHIRPYQNKPLYFLCSSAYTSKDVNTFTNFKNRCFKWGYFTEVNNIAENELQSKRENNDKPVILWAGRFLSWKHPDAAVRLAHRLKQNGYDFIMNIIGAGEMNSRLEKMISDLGLNNTVRLLGSFSPKKVREHMEHSDIFLFTSDFNEGWGAVLNEAMASGCAVVASHATGASPFLIRDGINGFMYKSGDELQLFEKTSFLISNSSVAQVVGLQAHRDMISLWSPKVASERLIRLNKAIENKTANSLYEDGPCSPAGILGNGWYKK